MRRLRRGWQHASTRSVLPRGCRCDAIHTRAPAAVPGARRPLPTPPRQSTLRLLPPRPSLHQRGQPGLGSKQPRLSGGVLTDRRIDRRVDLCKLGIPPPPPPPPPPTNQPTNRRTNPWLQRKGKESSRGYAAQPSVARTKMVISHAASLGCRGPSPTPPTSTREMAPWPCDTRQRWPPGTPAVCSA